MNLVKWKKKAFMGLLINFKIQRSKRIVQIQMMMKQMTMKK